MMIASNKGAGQNMCMPDVCLTPAPPAPPVPIPYPNISMNAQSTGFAMTVKVSGMNALNVGSQIPMSSGDEAGSSHSTIKGKAKWLMGCMNVKFAGKPAVTLTSTAMSNKGNAPAGAQLVPSVCNVFCNLASAGDSRVSRRDPRAAFTDVRALANALTDAPDTVQWGMIASDTGFIRIARFAAGVPERLAGALLAVRARGSRLVVLDLRGNPGGRLDVAIACAGLFLGAGVPVARVGGRARFSEIRTTARPVFAGPVAVLVDGGTASAAEVLALALRTFAGATLIGTRTAGKGHGACLVRAATDASRFALVIARVRGGDGFDYSDRGLTPDVPRLAPRANGIGIGVDTAPNPADRGSTHDTVPASRYSRQIEEVSHARS